MQRTSLGGDELPPIGDRSHQLLALLSVLDAYEYRIGGGIDAVLDWLTSSDATSSPVLEIWLTKPAPTTVLVELPLRLAAITAAVGDRTRLRAEAHTLRSSAGLVSALALAEARRRLESGGRRPDRGRAPRRRRQRRPALLARRLSCVPAGRSRR